jgi:hypothetical protein
MIELFIIFLFNIDQFSLLFSAGRPAPSYYSATGRQQQVQQQQQQQQQTIRNTNEVKYESSIPHIFVLFIYMLFSYFQATCGGGNTSNGSWAPVAILMFFSA